MSHYVRMAAPCLVTVMLATACDGGRDNSAVEDAAATSGARTVQRMSADAPPASAGGPTSETVALKLRGSDAGTMILTECPATPGRGLAFSAQTADHRGDGSAGVRVGGGFDGEEGRIVITMVYRQWKAEAGVGALRFERTDTRTAEGRSFVTITASGEALAGPDVLPFSLRVTCEPGGT